MTRPDNDDNVLPDDGVDRCATADRPTETDKTEIPIDVTNIDFLEKIFRQAPTSVYLVGLSGNPSLAKPRDWSGRGVPCDDLIEALVPTSQQNAYFSLATFRAGEDGAVRRKKANFEGQNAIMLDDVGTKVPFEAINALEPTWLLETSDGNFQAGYAFHEPITDIDMVESLMTAVIAKGLCDKGANGPTTRLARLPCGINGKHEPIFSTKLKKWNPDCTYTPKEIIAGFGLVLDDKSRKRTNKKRQGAFTPKHETNPIFDALFAQGLYKKSLGGGKHDITCPWVLSHTNGVDHGTAYFEPSEDYTRGGYKCLHGSCDNKHLADFIEAIGVDDVPNYARPTIRCEAGSIAYTVDAAEQVLAGTGQHFQRGGSIVVINRDPSTREEFITPLTTGALTLALAEGANWLQWKGEVKGYQPCDPLQRYVSALADRDTYKHLPVLRDIARQPFFRDDSSLCTKSGYDRQSGIYGTFSPEDYYIPLEPTRADASAALAVIEELLEEFPFAKPEDKSAVLSAYLTAVCRPSLANAPMYHVRSHSVGSGKSYLCLTINSFATDRRSSPMAFPNEDEECRKLLLAEFIRGPAVIEFDNMTTDILPHKALCTALTSESLSGRILGVSKTTSVSTRCLFLSSGNNVSPIRDMSRRCITINLNPQVEIPASRTFKRPELHRELAQQRPRYVSAALTIIHAYIIAGRPVTPSKAFAGFGDWSDMCRQPLLWLGLPDPASAIFTAMSDDPDRDLLDRLLKGWFRIFQTTNTMARNLITQAESDDEFKEILQDIAEERGQINRRKLGWWITRKEGRIVNGLRLSRASGARNASAWRVERVE